MHRQEKCNKADQNRYYDRGMKSPRISRGKNGAKIGVGVTLIEQLKEPPRSVRSTARKPHVTRQFLDLVDLN